MPLLKSKTQIVHITREPSQKIERCCDETNNVQMAFMRELQHLILWKPNEITENAESFKSCKNVVFFSIDHTTVDFSDDLAPQNWNENRHSDDRNCHALCYIMKQFFYDYSNEARQHVLAYAYVLLSRVVKHQQSRIPIATINAIVCSSLIVSSKLLDDDCMWNKYWAMGLLFGLKSLNRLEGDFLQLCHFDLFVTESVLKDAEMFLYTDDPGVPDGPVPMIN